MRYAAITDRLAGLGSDKWAVHMRAKAMKAAGDDVILLTIGEPDIAAPPQLVEAAHAAMKAGRTGYSNGRGEPGFVEAIAAKYAGRSGRAVGNENVLCFPGTQTALYATMTGLVGIGDEVLVGDPHYATYEGVIRSAGATLVPVPLSPDNGFRMRAADVERAITPRSRLLLLNTPHNPTGAVLTRGDIEALGAVARRHDLWIVADEVYEDLIYSGEFASPFDAPALADRTVAVASISKSHAAPGFRAGWAVGPAEFCSRLLPLSETMLFGGPPFIADAAAWALTHASTAAPAMRASYASRAERIVAVLDRLPGVSCRLPQAGMFVLADIRRLGLTGEGFAARLLDEARVAVMPGESFGEALKGWVRISLTAPDAAIDAALVRIAAFVRRLAPGEAA
ncbi:MAG: pyridoxal phosphate-dependent aminotransferase [Phyllobacteriaceae bacterium]|nr:pyridoxal phosphate-dependent aminotransferase [Phyllobacteriaceae bacterium]